MATYTQFKASGTKGMRSLDALFVVSAKVDTTKQNLVLNDLVDLFTLPPRTAVVGVLIKGKGAKNAAARNFQIGTAATANAVLDTTDLKAEDVNLYTDGQKVFFEDSTLIKLKSTTDATIDEFNAEISLVCVTI